MSGFRGCFASNSGLGVNRSNLLKPCDRKRKHVETIDLAYISVPQPLEPGVCVRMLIFGKIKRNENPLLQICPTTRANLLSLLPTGEDELIKFSLTRLDNF